ncbi:MAG: hypothetical protein IPL48_04595 [Bacteroidetes bacterium]|nr:hypothetical protein [Bacteroidota bacterium]
MDNKSKYNPQIHHRKSIRLKGYDYSQEGLYFITICTHKRKCLFGEIIKNADYDAEMILNEYRIIAHDEWLKTTEIRPNVELCEFVVMPNHFHGIIRLIGRGELHSPHNIDKPELHSPHNIDKPELHSPHNIDKPELHSPHNIDKPELHSPHNIDKPELHSPHNIDKPELHSPHNIDKPELHSPHNIDKPELHSPHNIDKPELHSPHNNETPELHLSDVDDMEKNKMGECNSPPQGPSQTIGAIIRGYKSSVTKQLNLLNIGCIVWRRNYHEHIIRNKQSYQNISNYIINNPSKWVEDKFYNK